jgi:hypothetical protein
MTQSRLLPVPCPCIALGSSADYCASLKSGASTRLHNSSDCSAPRAGNADVSSHTCTMSVTGGPSPSTAARKRDSRKSGTRTSTSGACPAPSTDRPSLLRASGFSFPIYRCGFTPCTKPLPSAFAAANRPRQVRGLLLPAFARSARNASASRWGELPRTIHRTGRSTTERRYTACHRRINCWPSDGRQLEVLIGKSSWRCAGINRRGVEDARALRAGNSEPLGPEFCSVHREVRIEA